MKETQKMSKDRIKEELESIKRKRSIFFWIAMSFILPGLMVFVMIAIMGGAGAPAAGYFLIAGIVIVLIGLVFGKKYLSYKSKYKDLKDKL